MPLKSHPVANFELEHQRLDALLRLHLLRLVAGDFGRAHESLLLWRQALDRHIAIEESRLLPHVPGHARWAAEVYKLEHERIILLADAYAARMGAVAAKPPEAADPTYAAVLGLIDAIHTLRHVLEHHHQREETALARELPDALQREAWVSEPKP